MKTIISSTHVDSHGDMMTLEALEQLRDKINSGRKVRFGVDHNKEFPPKGYVSNALISEKNGFHYLEAEYVEYENKQNVSWDDSLQIEFFDYDTPFVEVEKEAPTITEFSVDPNNFSDREQYKKYLKEMKAIGFEFKYHDHFRKALVSDPELIIKLACGTILYHLVKPTLEKIGEKVSDKLSGEVIKKGKQFYEFIYQAVLKLSYYAIPKTRPLFIVFEINGEPQIELIVKTRNPDLVLKSLQERKLKPVREEIESLCMKVDVDKIQFKLNDKGKWKFNYLLTKQGASLGKKETIKKRERRLAIIMENHKN